jgi:hypothetical protein
MKAFTKTLYGILIILISIESGFSSPVTHNFILDANRSVGTIGYSSDAGFYCEQSYNCEYLFQYTFSGSMSIIVDLENAFYNPIDNRWYGAVDIPNYDISGTWLSASSINLAPAWPFGVTPSATYQTKAFNLPDGIVDSFIDADSQLFGVIFGDQPSDSYWWPSVSGDLSKDPIVLQGQQGCYYFEVGTCANPMTFSFQANEVPIPSSIFLLISGIFTLVVKKTCRSLLP